MSEFSYSQRVVGVSVRHGVSRGKCFTQPEQGIEANQTFETANQNPKRPCDRFGEEIDGFQLFSGFYTPCTKDFMFFAMRRPEPFSVAQWCPFSFVWEGFNQQKRCPCFLMATGHLSLYEGQQHIQVMFMGSNWRGRGLKPLHSPSMMQDLDSQLGYPLWRIRHHTSWFLAKAVPCSGNMVAAVSWSIRSLLFRPLRSTCFRFVFTRTRATC